jgi:hypothetical protein
MTQERMQCQSCYRITFADKCVELAIAGPSHLACPTCFADVRALPPSIPAKEPESTLDVRVKAAQGVKP